MIQARLAHERALHSLSKPYSPYSPFAARRRTDHLDCSQEATFMMMVLECGSFSSAKLYLEVRHSRAVTGRAAGADGKEVPTREVFLRPVHGTKAPALYGELRLSFAPHRLSTIVSPVRRC